MIYKIHAKICKVYIYIPMIFFNQDYILVPFAIRLLCQQFPLVNLQEPRHYPIPRKPSWVAVCFLAKRLCTFALQVHDGAYTVFMFFFYTCVVWGYDSH